MNGELFLRKVENELGVGPLDEKMRETALRFRWVNDAVAELRRYLRLPDQTGRGKL